MNKLPLKTEFFTKVSYVKNEPKIAIVPVDMPDYEHAIPIGENPDAGFEGKVTIADIAAKSWIYQLSSLGSSQRLKSLPPMSVFGQLTEQTSKSS